MINYKIGSTHRFRLPLRMKKDKIVYFVSFETTLDSEEFISKWENYTSSVNTQGDVIIQQSEKSGKFRYIAEHFYDSGEFQFVVTKAVKVFHQSQVEVKIRQMGGYAIAQQGRKGEALPKESKVLVFIDNSQTDLKTYKALADKTDLNIYEGYYENCDFTFILEYYVKKNAIDALLAKLKELNQGVVEVYKERLLSVA